MKKKLICSLLAALVLSMPTATAFASTTKDIPKETVVEKISKPETKLELTQEQKKLLSDEGISEDDIVVLDKEKVFSKEQLKEMEELDEKEKAAGFTKAEIIVFERKQPKNKNMVESFSSHPDGIKRIDTLRTYTSGPVKLNAKNKRFGMAYWLDVTWNLTIGSYTKKAWKAATIIGINPSDFYNDEQPGDLLTRTYHKVYHDFYYSKYNKESKREWQYVRTSRLELTTYVNLYTVDKDGHSDPKHGSVENTYYSKHYGDGDWIYSEVNRRCKQNIQVIYLDTFK